MLYFSKLKLTVIYLIITFLFLSFFTNFSNNKDHFFLSKKINLGLDLQGGSYLLLEVDSKPLIKQNLQNKLISLRKLFKDEKIKYTNLTIHDETIEFKIIDNDKKKFEDFFLNKKNLINIYYDKYNDYELDYSFNNTFVSIKYSRFGLIELKNSSLDQSLEIVRRRIDEV